MKTFYIMGNADFESISQITWIDRRMGEVSMRFIGAGLRVPPDIPLHFSERLKKRQSREWFKAGYIPDKERKKLFVDRVSATDFKNKGIQQ